MDHFLAKFKNWIESDKVSNTPSFLWFEYKNILQDVCLFKSVTGKKSWWAWEFRIWPTSHFASTSNWSIRSTQILFYHPSNQLNSCKKPTTNTWGLQFWFQFLTKEPQLAGAGKQSNFLKSRPHKFHLNFEERFACSWNLLQKNPEPMCITWVKLAKRKVHGQIASLLWETVTTAIHTHVDISPTRNARQRFLRTGALLGIQFQEKKNTRTGTMLSWKLFHLFTICNPFVTPPWTNIHLQWI